MAERPALPPGVGEDDRVPAPPRDGLRDRVALDRDAEFGRYAACTLPPADSATRIPGGPA